MPFAINAQIAKVTAFSISVSFSLYDKYNQIMSVTNCSTPIEIRIPRDVNFRIHPMILQKTEVVFKTNSSNQNPLFLLYYVNLTDFGNHTISLHFEMKPSNTTLAYLLIMRFDDIPHLQPNRYDKWRIFCPKGNSCFFFKQCLYCFLNSDLDADMTYTFFVTKNHLQNHQSAIFGVRELNEIGICEENTDEPPEIHGDSQISANYSYRVYASGCYYLDKDNNLQSNGLEV
jgi:hypothetical protein